MLNRCKTVRRILPAVKAAVNVVTATVAATTAVVNALRATTQALKETAHSTLKQCHHLQRQQRRPRCWMQTARRLPQPSPANKASQAMGNDNPESAAAATAMAATAANVVTMLNAVKQPMGQSLPPKATQCLLILSQNRRYGSKNGGQPLLNL